MAFHFKSIAALVLIVGPALAFVVENSSGLINGRIIGGEDSAPNSAPYIVSLFLKGRQKDKPYCGGSIISKQWVISAAHCLKEPHYRIIAVAGLHNINDGSNTSISQSRRSDFYIKHENYSTLLGATAGSDIGLMHLNKPFEFNEFIQQIRLPEHPNVEGLVSLFGWGRTATGFKKEYPKSLQIAEMSTVDRSYCEQSHNTTIGEGTFCAGGQADKKGACVGDSGGPLVQKKSLVGIVSWGPITCSPEDGPTIFTNVGHYSKWIREKIDGDSFDANLIQ